MEDTHTLPSTMDGKEYMAGHHAATLRRLLWREHLGLLKSQPLDAADDPNAQPPGDGENDYSAGDEWDELVADPLGDKLWEMWTGRASTNTEVFRHLFHADPDDHIKTFEDYDKFLPKDSHKAGHLFDIYQPTEIVRQELDKIQGHLVWFPLKFLEDAEMAEKGYVHPVGAKPCARQPSARSISMSREIYADLLIFVGFKSIAGPSPSIHRVDFVQISSLDMSSMLICAERMNRHGHVDNVNNEYHMNSDNAAFKCAPSE